MVTTASTTTVTCPSCGARNRVPAAREGVPRCGRCQAALPWIATAGDDDFATVVEGATIPVLVDLWAPWCGPCRVVSPILERVATDRAGRVKLVKVNVDEAPALGQRFEARSIPTLLILDDGQVRSRRVGASTEQDLRAWVDETLDGD